MLDVEACAQINSESSALGERPCWLERAVYRPQRHDIELASHRWRGGHASAVAETRRNMIYALVEATGAVLS